MHLANRFAVITLGSIMLLCAHRSSAQVVSYNLALTASYEQTADNTPGTLQFVEVDSQVTTQNVDDANGGALTKPNNLGTIGLAKAFNQPLFTSAENFTDIAAASAAYPNGEYTFSLAGGTLGNVSRTLSVGGSVPVEPIFTGNTLSRLGSVDVSQDLIVTFNGFIGDGATTDNSIELFIRDNDRGNVLLDVTDKPGATSFVIPGGTLAAGTSYQIQLAYVNETDFSDGSGAAHGSLVFADFTTAVPEPTGALLLGLSGCALSRHRKRDGRGKIR